MKRARTFLDAYPHLRAEADDLAAYHRGANEAPPADVVDLTSGGPPASPPPPPPSPSAKET